MKLVIIYALLTLIVMVKGAWWATAAQPVMLGLGAVLGALNLDISEIPIEWNTFK